jgi:hypothetical protein
MVTLPLALPYAPSLQVSYTAKALSLHFHARKLAKWHSTRHFNLPITSPTIFSIIEPQVSDSIALAKADVSESKAGFYFSGCHTLIHALANSNLSQNPSKEEQIPCSVFSQTSHRILGTSSSRIPAHLSVGCTQGSSPEFERDSLSYPERRFSYPYAADP